MYQDMILDHYRSPRNYGKLEKPTNRAQAYNPLCGDRISIDLKSDKGIVKEIGFEAVGCAISKASASLLTDYVKGKKMSELRGLNKDFITDLTGMELGPTRLKCLLLSLETLQKILNGQ